VEVCVSATLVQVCVVGGKYESMRHLQHLRLFPCMIPIILSCVPSPGSTTASSSTAKGEEDNDTKSLLECRLATDLRVGVEFTARVDEMEGTEELNFSFLVPIGPEGLSNCPEIALLPPRQPREAGAPPVDPNYLGC
jgi:hypothetical protein